jgi:hypothetical protein
MNVNSSEETCNAELPQGGTDIRHLSTEQLAQLGLAKLAYVKPIVVNGAAGFAIHAADGTPMAVAADREVAIAAILQHEMVPALVH